MKFRRFAGLCAVLALAGCVARPIYQNPPVVSVSPPVAPAPSLKLARAGFGDLPGWAEDHPVAAIPAFLASCRALGGEADWRQPCTDAALVPLGDDNAARHFFETDFVPFHATNGDQATGLFTGYYEIALRASRQHGGPYQTPLYHRPADLVSVDLGLFRQSLKGQRIAGRVTGGRLVPYADRAAIEAGAIDGRGLEFLWVDDPIDAFFLAVQGSGRATLPDGSTIRIGYDAANGRPYVSIGHLLAETGIPPEQISLPYLRQWITAHPETGRALMDRNPSYVFFREMSGDGPMGAEGVALTPGRSAAVDPAFIQYGLPVWIDTTDPIEPSGRLQRLLVAQDTGGAIRGPVRGDIFFGFGPDAERHAGLMRGQGSWWLLLPQSLAARQS